jgi:hypothetical protein
MQVTLNSAVVYTLRDLGPSCSGRRYGAQWNSVRNNIFGNGTNGIGMLSVKEKVLLTINMFIIVITLPLFGYLTRNPLMGASYVHCSSIGMWSMQFSFHIKAVHVPDINKQLVDYFTDAMGNFSSTARMPIPSQFRGHFWHISHPVNIRSTTKLRT